MLRGVSGAVAVAVAALIVCCHADPRPEQDGSLGEHGAEHYEAGHKTHLKLYGNRLLRPVRDTYRLLQPEAILKQRTPRAVKSVNRRNFDEIDQTTMPFPYHNKRYTYFSKYGNYIDTPSVVQDYEKRRDVPFDEIDLSQFPIGSKRSMNWE